MSEIGVTLRISKVGDREAMTSLNLLDQKGQQVVENIAGRTGKSLGAVASAYTRASAEGQKYFQEVAAGYQKVAAEEAKAATSAERAANALEGRQAHAVASATRGLEMLGRTGQITGRSLDAVVGQVSALAFSFGPTGQLVAAVGIATAAVVEMFMRTSREAKKLADETLKEFGRIAHSDVSAQGSEAARMFSGDEFATNELDKQGISGNRREAARLQGIIAAGTQTRVGRGGVVKVLSADAQEAAANLEKVSDWLKKIEPIYASVFGVNGQGGSLAKAARNQIASDLPGFVTDAQKDADRAAHEAETAAKKAAQVYAKSLAKDMVEASKMAREAMIADLTVSRGLENSLFALPKLDFKGISEQIAETIANDPIVNAAKAAKDLGKRLGAMLQDGIADGISNAFRDGFGRAFAGGGAVGFIEGFGEAVLSSLGGIMERMGAALISYGVSMELVAAGLSNPFTSGPAAIAAGTLLVGLGAALNAAVSGHGSTSVGGSSAGYSGSSVPQLIDRGVITPGSYSTRDASTIQARPSVTVNVGVINPNDGGTQRVIDEINRKIRQNGSLAGSR